MRCFGLLFFLFSVALARGNVVFHKDILPVLQEYCFDCHGEDTQKGDLSLHLTGPDFADKTDLANWELVLEQLEIVQMPPSKKKQPSAAERARVIEWIQEGLTKAGKGFAVQARLLLPEYGNRISHELLFDGSIDEVPFTPARLWRMSPHVYRGKRYQSIVSGGIEAEPVSYISKSSGIRDYADQEIMDESGFLALRMAFSDIIASQMHDRELPGLSYGPNKDKPIRIAGKESFKAISESDEVPSDAVMGALVREEFERACGRPMTEEEFARYLAFMKFNVKEGGNEAGLKVTLLGIYLSSEAVYRLELGRGEPDEHGRRMLSPQEIAFALAYALTDSPPAKNRFIKEALDGNKLQSKADVERVLRRMIADGSPPIRKNLPASMFHAMIQSAERGYGYYPRVVRFFEEFFQYPKAAGTFKDSPGAPVGSRALVGAPQGHIVRIVNEDRQVFEELLTSPRFNMNKTEMIGMLNRRHAEKLKSSPKEQHPQLEEKHLKMLKRAEKDLNDDTFRSGMLHDQSWLIAHSTNDQNDPVHRGIWVRERLLAGNVPALPIGVDANVPEAHDRTLRQRFEVTQKAECWRCHKIFEPLGMPFESFTDRGWVRTGMFYNTKKKIFETELKPDKIAVGLKNGLLVEYPWDTSGGISGTGEPGIDGPVKDASDLVHRLAKSTRVRQSIIRHAFRFWMGRNETLTDSQTLIAADKAYVASDGKFSEVLVSLLSSDSFLYRK
jgi:hypothetical protein